MGENCRNFVRIHTVIASESIAHICSWTAIYTGNNQGRWRLRRRKREVWGQLTVFTYGE